MFLPWLSDRISTALLILSITLLLALTGAMSRIDTVIYDTSQRHQDKDIPTDVVIVTIDEQSLSTLGRWPWNRRLHAQLIDRVHADGALVIGYDVMFAEPQLDDMGADQQLTQAIARAGNVVLPVVIETVRRNGQLIETLPLPPMTAQAAGLGRVHAELDADAIARSITLWEGLGQAFWPHFAQVMLSVVGQLPNLMASEPPSTQVANPAFLMKHDVRYINFSTEQQHLPSLPFAQVLQGEFAPGTFSNKLVLVGATASGMADSLPTPISGLQQPMAGVEFLANAMLSMRSQTMIKLAPNWLSTLFACGVALMPMLWLPVVRARTGLFVTLTFAVLVFIATIMTPLVLKVWVPMSAGFIGLLCAYPLWAWRKLESTSRYLDAELARLHKGFKHKGVIPTANKNPSPIYIADRFELHIEQVRTLAHQVQQLELEHQENLAFVSHDIRVPLASAAALVQQTLGNEHLAHKQLIRALAWTEDYLQTSRAQMLKTETFVELDVISLLHQVADEIYPLVQANAIHLTLSVPEDPVWVTGDFDTLSRAITNLMSNAVKFSPSNSNVTLGAFVCDNKINITVSDEGPGISTQDIHRLFKRFQRLENPNSNTHVGVGLGLYFVEVTVKQHGGNVHVQSQVGNTSFTIQLPISL